MASNIHNAQQIYPYTAQKAQNQGQRGLSQDEMFGDANHPRHQSEEKKRYEELRKFRAQLSMDDPSSAAGLDQTLNNRSVNFNASDGNTLDIGDAEEYEQEDAKSDSEEERKTLYGNDASNFLSYTKMIKVVNDKHPRKKVYDEAT